MYICPECGISESRSWVHCKKYPPKEENGFRGNPICMHHCRTCDFHTDSFKCLYQTEEEKLMAAVEFMKCHRCGSRFQKGGNFCPACGEKIVQECKSCWVRNGEPFNCRQKICPGHKLPILLAADASLKGDNSNV